MGQLTNLYVSQSYQGLLKMTDSTNGLTNTLQTVQTGDGDNSPLQMSLTQVNITGSLTVNGNPVSNVDTGSLVTTASFNAYTSSVNTHLAGLDVETGSLQNQINGLATTGSLSGYTTVTTFNNYTGSNDAKVNELISKTGSYVTETESGSFVTDVSNGLTNDVVVVTYGNGSNHNFTVNNVNNSVSSSFSQYAVSASYAPDNSNRNGLINTGSLGGNQSITGSLNVGGTITATSASFTYVNTVYETASVIYSSGSNQLGDASNDTQTLWGTVNLPSGPLVITGSVTSTGGFNGNLTGTASYATNALSASYAPDNSNRNGLINTGSIAGTQSITGSLIVSGSESVIGDIGINGNTNITGALNVINSTGNSNIFGGTNNTTQFNGKVIVTGSLGVGQIIYPSGSNGLVLLGTKNVATSSLTNYLNAITGSADDNSFNIALIPGSGLAPTGIGALTGSVFISGSNNILLNIGSGVPSTQGRRQIYSNGNIGLTAPTINTSSLTIPAINNNYQAGGLVLTLATGSNLGNNTHVFSSNINNGNITWNHPSASITTGNAGSTVTNNINVGTLTSTTTGPTILTVQSTLQNNIISNGALALNLISSSIQTTNNVIGGTNTTINNRYYTTGSNNFLAVSSNIIGGQGVTINTAGAPSTNVSRTLVGNILGGQAVTVSLEANNTDAAGLRNSIAVGYGLTVSGSHSAALASNQGAAYFGRYNSEDNGLSDVSRTVFAVGTGNAFGSRRTSLYVTSGSLVGVSGSLDVKGVTNAFTVTGSANITHGIAGQPALTLVGLSATQPGLNITGSLDISGSVSIANGGDLSMYGHKMFNVGAFQSTQTQSGSANVSQSISYNTTDYSQGVSVAGSQITVANAGVYNIQFSAQIDRVAGSGTDTVHIWLKKNGSNVVGSAGAITISGGAAAAKTISSWNYVVDSAANDYYELVWQSTDSNIQLIAATASGNIPSIPSIITTVTQVR